MGQYSRALHLHGDVSGQIVFWSVNPSDFPSLSISCRRGFKSYNAIQDQNGVLNVRIRMRLHDVGSHGFKYRAGIQNFGDLRMMLPMPYARNNHSRARLSLSRIVFYLNRLYNIARWGNKDLDKMTVEDLKALVTSINQMNYAETTKKDHRVTMRKFYGWLDGGVERVEWVSLRIPRNKKELPREILTIEDFQAMAKVANNVRDKAFVSVLGEMGCRIGELLSPKIKDVEFDKYGARIMVHGKTGWGKKRIVSSVPSLSNWLAHHPLKDDPEVWLWVGLGTKNKGKLISYEVARKILRTLAKKTGIKKKVNPHNFKHSRATQLASKLPGKCLNVYFNWTMNSRQPATYIHLSGGETDDAYLALHGRQKQKDKNNGQLIPVNCPYCKTENEPESEYCLTCRRPLTIKAAVDAEKKEQELLEMLRNFPQMVESIVEQKLQEVRAQLKATPVAGV